MNIPGIASGVIKNIPGKENEIFTDRKMSTRTARFFGCRPKLNEWERGKGNRITDRPSPLVLPQPPPVARRVGNYKETENEFSRFSFKCARKVDRRKTSSLKRYKAET
ncbi:hypothetical protein GWI33_003324 [Rhynchophorus ferrugineus]|uniref:Uncharacterized protein n=1 Tax=Rhynchophorus ferrugineus TaxID=354439 RepID=A0A834MFV3_RHYFE|nr:hypothetical protein GWI33_003324 [Rhynchophorus ferrugineus]